MPIKVLCIYIGALSVISVILCTYDKLISKRNKVSLRIPEATLMWLSVLGSAVAMLLWMLIIRHKTKHPKFMVGLPVIIVLQAALVAALLHFGIFII